MKRLQTDECVYATSKRQLCDERGRAHKHGIAEYCSQQTYYVDKQDRRLMSIQLVTEHGSGQRSLCFLGIC
jgi:hypothetical protein